MQNKKGISLIVLVITIIVMVILAAAIVITLSNTGIINKANQAVSKTNRKQIEQIASLAWSEAFMDGARTQSELQTAVNNALKGVDTTGVTVTVTTTGVTVTDGNGSTPQTGWRIEREYDADGLITKAVVTDGTVSYEIGTTVNYMPDGVGSTSYKGGWKLLGVDDQGRLLIMSADSVNGTAQLSGQDGYINGLTHLQSAVAEFKDGTIGVEVRSVTVEDIDAVTGYNPKTFKGEEYLDAMVAYTKTMQPSMTEAEIEASLLSTFGVTSREQMAILDNGMQVTYSWDGTEYPKYSYVKNNETITGNLTQSHSSNGFTYYDSASNSFKTVAYTTTVGDIVTVKNDMYCYIVALKYKEDSKAYKMLFMTADGSSASTYWLASRYASTNPYFVNFCVRRVNDGGLVGSILVNSIGSYDTPYYAVRAVVTLASGIALKDSTTVTGTYDIVQ